MNKRLILLLLVLGAGWWYLSRPRLPRANWDGKQWSCPDGYTVYASETELVAGETFVHCVR